MKAAASMKAAKAGSAPEGVASCNPAVTETAEGAGVRPGHAVRRIGAVNRVMPAKGPARRTGAPIERPSRTETIAIDDGPAVRDVRIVVVDDSAAAAPIKSPIVPTPAEAAIESNTEAQSKTNSRAVQKKPRIRIPSGEDSQWSPVDQPGIILWDVNRVCSCRFNDDRLSASCLLSPAACFASSRPVEPVRAWFELPGSVPAAG